MFHNGQLITLKSGARVQIEQFLNAGGESTVYTATNERTGERGALKTFNTGSPERAARTKFLVDQCLSEVCEYFCAPSDWFHNGSMGHFSRFAPGHSLEEYLSIPGNSFFENFTIAIALAHEIALLLEHRNMAHGDLHLGNFYVAKTVGGVEVFPLDFDNFNVPGVSPPMAVGHELYMAAELRLALKKGQPAIPDEYSDRFALTGLLHDIILAKHAASGFDANADEFENTMVSGRWLHDPILNNESGGIGGYSSQILNADLARMFRHGFGLSRHERPSAAQWRDLLSDNFAMIYVHPRCQGPFFIDPGKTRCPYCGQRFPVMRLVFPSVGRHVVCDSGAIPIGRTLLYSQKVSAHHAVVRKIGPETRLESCGKNGTFRWDGSQWLKLDKEVLIQAGDRLKFADVECCVNEDH
jgi:hypothetical protein